MVKQILIVVMVGSLLWVFCAESTRRISVFGLASIRIRTIDYPQDYCDAQ